MNIAIYSRKSKFSEKGESIENQIQFCKAYGDTHLPHIEDKHYVTYEDEGFSAATSQRPNFQKLLGDIKTQKIQMLLCYRLDRITRKVSDFSKTLELLEQMNVGFISATENFDTSTPIGKAMIYIASVFAQLERETTAERIRDNMLALSRTGRWLGGQTPMGYSSKEVLFLDAEFRERKLYQLVEKEEELNIVHLLFQKYLEFGSLSAVESYCLTKGINTRNGCFFNKSSIAQILENPTYCIGDAHSYDYFNSLGCCITYPRNEFAGTRGILCYNRTGRQAKSMRCKRPTAQWVIALGKHKGIISGQMFSSVQNSLKKNREKASPRKETSSYALVSGRIECSICGSRLRIKNIRKGKDTIHYSYACEMKTLSKQSKCETPNINGSEFDSKLMDIISEYLVNSMDPKKLLSYLKQKNSLVRSEVSYSSAALKSMLKEREDYTNEIQIIINRLSTETSPLLEKYLIPRLQELDGNLTVLNRQIENTSLLHASELPGTDIRNLRSLINSADIGTKKILIGALINKIQWDGSRAYITFNTP